MKKLVGLFLILFLYIPSLWAQEVHIKFLITSDVHGNYFPYNFITQEGWEGSLARVYSYVEQQRKALNNQVVLLDNGDILQGQPTAYYSNFIDTVSPHITSSVMNYMKYDIGNVGNHDVETGRSVMGRWIRECNFPVLGANIMDETTHVSYLRPYEIIQRGGVKIAVLGMITPAIPVWLPQNLWKGLYFDDMEKTAQKWVKIIQEEEQPDVLIGIFHAGKEPRQMGEYLDNASMLVAQNVPGFDVVMFGHDHQKACEKVDNIAGDSVLIINPANNAFFLGDVDIKLTYDQNSLIDKEVEGRLVDLRKTEVSKDFMKHFDQEFNTIKDFVSAKIGEFSTTISTRDAYFGSSAFIDLIHNLQLDISKADISFVAPLSFDAQIDKGDVFVSDMFNLYKYENMLYVMELSGQEIKDFLEMSYSQWINQMKSPEDHLLLLKEERTGSDERTVFKYFSYNFDSAAGIIYDVDVTQSQGNMIHIKSMADGTPFDLTKTYKVALNSYRGNGGGELLTKGAGIPHDELTSRIVYATDKDLRYYLMETIRKQGKIDPKPLNQWKFIPEEWTIPAAKRDYKLLFGAEK
ncbi:bifunctional metallophosphatase/5'-nucleotidase [Bacteroides coprosuis]|uniref:bifunctional metallophosphatase/5'-nucleotidase n=1 Tax=Bacteroides coprosuis TaxID=151276 RepID=UPI001D57EA3A|nr:5'-nucleotidase C-terminal domain-containing protein [Bacteroides coprosuis]HJD91495.1 5'-nucleotidase C-terminal domain-containing protein [Bacteroides coprosuis]